MNFIMYQFLYNHNTFDKTDHTVVTKKSGRDSWRRALLQACSYLVVTNFARKFRKIKLVTTKNGNLEIYVIYGGLKEHVVCSYIGRNIGLFEKNGNYNVTTKKLQNYNLFILYRNSLNRGYINE